MAFVTVPTVNKLVYVDELPWCFIVPAEREAMRLVAGFKMYHPQGGYYKIIKVKTIEESNEHLH